MFVITGIFIDQYDGLTVNVAFVCMLVSVLFQLYEQYTNVCFTKALVEFDFT